MKKVILILGLISLILTVNAQNQATIKNEGGIKGFTYTGVATSDTVNTATGYAYIYWDMKAMQSAYYYVCEAEIDEISGSASAYVVLEGSNDNSHWNLIDSLVTVNTSTEALSADGTIILSDLSTGVLWRYLRVKLTESTTGVWDFNYVIFKAVGKNE